jgi:predicted RecB family nuclease
VESSPQIRQDTLVEQWLRQVVGFESDVDHVLQQGSAQDKLDFFWQNWGQDTCGRCAFQPLCLEKATPEALIAEGFLRPRKASPRDVAEVAAKTP